MEIRACAQQVTDSFNRRNQEGRTGIQESAIAVPSMQMPYIDRTVSRSTNDARKVIKGPKPLRDKKGLMKAANDIGDVSPREGDRPLSISDSAEFKVHLKPDCWPWISGQS